MAADAVFYQRLFKIILETLLIPGFEMTINNAAPLIWAFLINLRVHF